MKQNKYIVGYGITCLNGKHGYIELEKPLLVWNQKEKNYSKIQYAAENGVNPENIYLTTREIPYPLG